jgi:hypothetical protein
MHFPAIVLLVLTALCPAVAAAQTTLNKCIDAQGLVTYTNKPCINAREVHTVEIDPAPTPDRPQIKASQAPASKPAATKPAPNSSVLGRSEVQRTQKRISPAKIPAKLPSAKTCDALSDKLGRTLDKMDQAHRKGYTLDQMDKWNEEVRDLERKKQLSGCF